MCPRPPRSDKVGGAASGRRLSPISLRSPHCANTGFGGSAQPGMLMFMTISHDGAPEPTALDSSRRAPGTPARSPDTVKALVGSSDVPLAAVDLPSGRFLAVNPALVGAPAST